MDTQKAPTLTDARWFKIVVAIVTLIVLSPVIGMVIAFAVIPALPIVLSLGYVLGPINFLADREEDEEEQRWSHPEPLAGWDHLRGHARLAHAHS
jgi:hypothetical protein